MSRERFVLLLLVLLAVQTVTIAQDNYSPDKDDYRRSSLCLILLTHKNKKYAEEMQRIFQDFPMPARYNEHNISDVRVISVYGKQLKSDIDRLLNQHNIAQKVVAKWFNRNSYTGYMDMGLIHDRGGYGAFYDDYRRSLSTVRGTDLLKDEGIELLQNTFVLVCDMDYIDKKKGAAWGAVGMALLSAGMQGMAQANYAEAQRAAYAGNYSKVREKQRAAQSWNMGSQLGAIGTAVVADIGGFRVKMNAYLYKLQWNDQLTQTMYEKYWTDSEMNASEITSRKNSFDNSGHEFQLDFVGQYRSTSSKTILRSWNNEDEVILDVCQRCVKKGLNELAKRFPVFKPRTPFYFDGSTMYSHIGRKEEVSYGKQYEIVERRKNKRGEIYYKRIGKVEAATPWDNREIRFDQYFNPEQKGTRFYIKKASTEYLKTTPGLQIREL